MFCLFFQFLQHDSAGVVSMANTGHPNTNNSQFFITLSPCPHLDGRNVVVGKVIKGLSIAQEIGNSETVDDRPVLVGEIEFSSQNHMSEF